MYKKILFGIGLFLFLCSDLYTNIAFAVDNELDLYDDNLVSVFDRAHPDYDPIGIRTSSFVIHPSLEIEERFDDNIYATESNTEEDFITVIKPVIDISSKWSKHEVNLILEGEFGFYLDNEDENYEDYKAEFNTRFDILRDTYIKSTFLYARRHEERGFPESASNAVEPIEYGDFLASLGFVHSPGKFSFEINTDFRNLDFDDGMSAIPSVIDQDIRDRNEYGGYVNFGYEFIPNYKAFVEIGGSIREYDQAASSVKDSEGYYILGGTEINISGKAKGRVYAGYMSRDYDSSTYENIDGIKAGGELLWNITQLTSLIAEASRSIEETFLTTYSGYTLTEADLTLEHELKRNILLAASVGWDNYDYKGTPTPERNDDLIYAGVEAKYLINRNFSAGVGYEYENRNSNIVGDDYDKNVFLISAKAAF